MPVEVSRYDYMTCAVCIILAQGKINSRGAQTLLAKLNGGLAGYPAYAPLTYMWDYYFASSVHTSESYERYFALKNFCNTRIESYIKQLNEGTLAWNTFPSELTNESKIFHTPLSLPSTLVPASFSSTASTQKSLQTKTTLDQLRSRMATLLAKESSTP
jgi:hypothetical protein